MIAATQPRPESVAAARLLLRALFDEDQPRDERGQWTDGGGGSPSAFHGTTLAAAKAIKERGLLLSRAGTDPGVFATPDKDMALSYAATRAFNAGRETLAVVEVDRSHFEPRPVMGDEWRSNRDVPPSAVRAVYLFKMRDVVQGNKVKGWREVKPFKVLASLGSVFFPLTDTDLIVLSGQRHTALIAATVVLRALDAVAEPEWRTVHRAADRRRKEVAQAVEAGFAAIRDRLDREALRRALEAGDAAEAERLVAEAVDAAGKTAASSLAAELRAIALDAARAVARRAEAKGAFRGAAAPPPRLTLEGSFQLVNPRASEWARKYAAEKIVEFGEVTKLTKQTIARIISSGLAKQTDLDKVADRIEGQIGLREDQVTWLENWRDENDPTDEQYERMSDKLLGERADMIARTETIAAATEGQQLLWESAAERGLLPDGVLQKWIVTPDDRLCVVCEGMEGQTAALGDEFDTGDDNLGTVSGPPAHPNCRCALGLVFPGEDGADA